jgi:serine protease Do
MPARRSTLRRSSLAIALLAATALGSYGLGHGAFAEDVSKPPVGAGQVLPDFTELASRVKPAVVTVLSDLAPGAATDDSDSSGGDQGAGPDQGGGGPQASPFPFPLPFPFNMMPQGPGGGGMQGQRPQMVEAAGSGFIIDEDGTVVTNNHVVQGAKTVTVTLADGTKLPAAVIGRDPSTDVAVLRIKADHKLPFIELGDSSKVKTGQWVVAMGNPFGLGGTVTAGIVSAEGRDIGDGPYDSFLQVDAPINKGNSGGPLFDQSGQVVGMNTAILSPSGGSVGIGFSIPSNTVKSVVAQIEKVGHVTRGFLGVSAQSVDASMSQALRLPGDGKGPLNGALVAAVEPNSPAQKAGLQPGDVIESVNGTVIHNPRDLAVEIAGIVPGDKAALDIIRNGKAEDISAQVAELKTRVANNAQNQQPNAHRGGVGLALAPLTPSLRDQLSVPDGTDGAVVAQVVPNSPADQAGLQQGDVVLGVNSSNVGSPDQAAQAIRQAIKTNGNALALRILRNGQPIFVAVTPKTAG